MPTELQKLVTDISRLRDRKKFRSRTLSIAKVMMR